MSKFRECKKCINSDINPSVTINQEGYCNICEAFLKSSNPKLLNSELEWFFSSADREKGKYNVMFGLSGGKDSTSALCRIIQMGLKPTTFTFDIGYYPQHIFERSRQFAKHMNVQHEVIQIQQHIRKLDLECYKLTAELFEQEEGLELEEKFRNLYQFGRQHYSIKDEEIFPFVRTCQLCRRTVIRAYYAEAVKRGIGFVVLGINEWTNLSLSQGTFSGIRRLQPSPLMPPVYVVHLPFLLQTTIEDNKKLLSEIGWNKPIGEKLIESNSNSCLFAAAAESKTNRLLGFHPDTTRLAREVTVGFISKDEAKESLNKKHEYPFSVKEVLKQAKMI